MLTAFVRSPEGPVEMVSGADAAGALVARPERIVWVDLEDPAKEELEAVGRWFELSEEALEDCVAGEQRPRIDEYDDYVFMLLYGMVGGDDSEVYPRKLAVFMSERFLVTVHVDALQSVREMRERCRRHGSVVLRRGLDHLLYLIVDAVVDRYLLVARRYEDILNDLEERSVGAAQTEQILTDLSAARRGVLEVRQMAMALRDVVSPIVRGELDYISDGLERRFGHVHDHLVQVVELTDRQRELLHEIRANLDGALSNRLNRSMQTLTGFATVLLPLSVLAGIYGMNLRLWPSEEHAWGFPAVLAVMLVVAVGVLVVFRRRQWL